MPPSVQWLGNGMGSHAFKCAPMASPDPLNKYHKFWPSSSAPFCAPGAPRSRLEPVDAEAALPDAAIFAGLRRPSGGPDVNLQSLRGEAEQPASLTANNRITPTKKVQKWKLCAMMDRPDAMRWKSPPNCYSAYYILLKLYLTRLFNK